MNYNVNNNGNSTINEPPHKRCYCDPSFEQAKSSCNPAGCKTTSAIFIVGFLVILAFCIYRFKQLRTRKDNRWPMLTLTLLTLTSIARIVRSVLILSEEENFIIMGLLFLLPLGVLICSFLNTLYVWVKIIFHFNFSKVVSKIFPFLGKIFIVSQIILMILLLIVCFAGLRYNASNIVLLVFLSYGGISAVIFTKMIWDEYKDLSSKDCGVFSNSNNQKIRKIFKLSITGIIVTFATLGLTIWSFLVKGVLTISHTIAFNFIGRSIEIAWISVMLIILAPELQTWDQNSVRTKDSTNFDNLSDASSDADDIENDHNDLNSPKDNLPIDKNGANQDTTTAVVTTSPVNNSNINQNQSFELSENINSNDKKD